MVHTNFQEKIFEDLRIFSRRTRKLFCSKINCVTESLKLFFFDFKEMAAKSKKQFSRKSTVNRSSLSSKVLPHQKCGQILVRERFTAHSQEKSGKQFSFRCSIHSQQKFFFNRKFFEKILRSSSCNLLDERRLIGAALHEFCTEESNCERELLILFVACVLE